MADVLSELPEEQIASARDLNTLIQEIVLEAVNSVNYLNVQNDVERKCLLLESNLFAKNINAIVFHLQNVVSNLEDGVEEKRDLVQLIAKLVESSYAVLNEINKNTYDLKIALKAKLLQAAIVSENLLKMIEKNKLRESSKMLLFALADLLHAIDFVKIQNKVLNESPDKIKEFLKEGAKRIYNVINTFILQNDKLDVHRIIDSINHHCRHLESVINVFLQQHGDRYAEGLPKLMTDTCKDLHDAEIELQKFYTETNDVVSLVDLVTKNVNKRCEVVAKLIRALDIEEAVDTAREILAATDEDNSPEISNRRMQVRH